MNPTDKPESRLRIPQVLIAAMAMGLLAFAAVVAYIVREARTTPPMVQSASEIGMVVKGLTVVGVILGWVLWRVFLKQARARAQGQEQAEAADTVFPLFQTALVLRAALIEGPGLFAVTATMLTGNWWNMAWAGVALAGFIAIFPTRGTFAHYVEEATGRR